MQPSPTSPGLPAVAYALLGVALFTIGGMVLEDAMGGDGLTFVGCLFIAMGLVGIVAGGVKFGIRH